MNQELTLLESQILKILESHRGRANLIGRFDLVERINQECSPASEREIRATITHLVEEHAVWIGSCPKGYFMIQTDEELLAVCKYYHSYAMSLLYKEAKLRKISLHQLLGQLSFEFREES